MAGGRRAAESAYQVRAEISAEISAEVGQRGAMCHALSAVGRCWLNLAAVAIKRAAWADATAMCDRVLACDPVHVKALYRRADVRHAIPT